MDITIGRKQHLNIGNYSSVEPSIHLTLKNVDLYNINWAQEKLSDLVDLMSLKELYKSINELREMVQMNNTVIKFVEIYEKSENKIEKNINKLTEELNGVDE